MERPTMPYADHYCSTIQTDQSWIDDLWLRTAKATYNDHGASNWDGRLVRMGPPWLRDHVHELKGLKYFIPDMKTGLETFFRRQFSDGHFPDFFVPTWDKHALFVHPRFELIDEQHGQIFIRVPVEADLEYLAVEGVFAAWQATGDSEWMASQLPVLEKGLHCLMSDPLRWSAEHGLVKRPFTIDTWDFLDFFTNDWMTTNVAIRVMNSETPMCLFHGDNSGLYAAACQMARMYEAVNSGIAAAKWGDISMQIQERANRLLWSGQYYIHQVHLDPEEAARYDETGRLSLSNTYDVNRGLPTHEMSVSIIDEFRRRRESQKDSYFAEWFTIDPPYQPKFAWFEPGEYVNGGLFLAVGGELAKAALNHGREAYGIDVLRRLLDFISEKNEVGFMYRPDKRPYGGGPVGWCSAAIQSALMEALAGVVDDSVRFQEVSLMPRWIAAGVDEAEVTAHYPGSNAFFRYHFHHSPCEKRMRIEWEGEADQVHLRALLPENTSAPSAKCDGEDFLVLPDIVESSPYAEVDLSRRNGKIVIDYR